MIEKKEIIKNKLTEYLYLQGIDTNKPFLCLNPEHEDTNPSMNIAPDKQHVKCFSCGAYFDIFDLIGIDNNLKEFKDQYKKALEIFNIGENSKMKNIILPLKEEVNPEKDYTLYFVSSNINLEKTDYPTKQRGLSIEVLDKFNIGYDPDITSLIIPTSKHSYVSRNTKPNIDKKDRYRKKGKANIFNLKAIKEPVSSVFIVEGEIDALSIIDVGGAAIGLGSTANKNKLLSYLKDNKPNKPFIIALDEDETGLAATQQLEAGLQSLSIPYVNNLTFEPYKDANELLFKDREKLRTRIKEAQKQAIEVSKKIETEEMAEKEKKKKDYSKKSTGGRLQTFLHDIEINKVIPIPTGYNNLDILLNGGLVGGLYGIGAISSLGKTTFILQMADQIAQGGKDVLIFSLEMNKKTLIAKSLSRIMYQRAGNPELNSNYQALKFTGNKKDKPKEDSNTVLTSQEILQGCKYSKCGNGKPTTTQIEEIEREALKNAIEEYKQYGNHVYIFEPTDIEKESYGLDIDKIKETVKTHISITGKTPVVIVDYLQLIQPIDDKGNDKSNTDKAVHGLKAISDNISTPVIAISSFNRNSYNAPVNLASFKESGGIEYSCDVLIGLQYQLDFDKKIESGKKGATPEDLLQAKKEKHANIEAVILKNRNGQTGDTINYIFTGKYNTFKENGQK